MSLTEGTIKAFLSASSKLQDITEAEKHAVQHIASWLSSRGGACLPGDAFDDELANQDEETQDLAAAFTSCSLRGSLVALQKWSSKTANPRSRSERTSDSGPLTALASNNPELLAELSKLGTWDFDVFAVDSVSAGHPLEAVGMASLQQLGLIEELGLPHDKLRNFLRAVEKQYLRNPYHCSMHAADVVQTLTAIVTLDKMRDVLTPLELLALTVAAIIHDMGHQGVSNDFHVQTGSEWAVTYNDQSPNENYHIAAAWKTLCKPHNDFLCHLPKEQRQFLRSVLVELVLATDMKLHHSLLNDLKADVALFGADLSTWGASARAHLLAFVLHCADIGNCVKPLDKSERWAKLVNAEFWEQGDKERSLGLPLSTLNDRHTANIPRSQKFFLELFGKPSYEVLGHLAPVTGALAAQHYAANLAYWEDLIARGVTTL